MNERTDEEKKMLHLNLIFPCLIIYLFVNEGRVDENQKYQIVGIISFLKKNKSTRNSNYLLQLNCMKYVGGYKFSDSLSSSETTNSNQLSTSKEALL